MSNIVIQFVPSQWLLRSFSFGRLRFIRQRRAEAKKEHYDALKRDSFRISWRVFQKTNQGVSKTRVPMHHWVSAKFADRTKERKYHA
jgi:hypothetical protein